MGRIISSGALGGGGGSGSNGLQAASTVVTVGEAVQQGQLAVIGADNLAYYAVDPATISASLRPVLNPAPITNGLQIPVTQLAASAILGTTDPTMAGCVLGNGNYVLAWQTTTSLQFGIYSSTGALQGAIQTVGTPAGNYKGLYAAALTSGGFALSFNDATANPKYAVFDNAGNVVKALSTVEAIGVSPISLHMVALTGGGFVIGYFNGTTFSFRYAVFDNTGAVVKAGSQVVAGTAISNYSQSVSVAALAGGGFVVTCATTNGTNSNVQFGRYNAAGVLQGAVTSAGTNTSTSGGFIRTAGLTGGGFAILINGTGVGCVASIWNAAGVQQGANITLSATAVAIYPSNDDVVALPNGNAAFVCSGVGSGDKAVAYVNGTNGALVASLLGSQTGGTLGSSIGVTALSTNGIAIASPGVVTTVDANCNLIAATPVAGMTAGTYNNSVVLQVTNPLRASAVTFVVATSGANVWQTIVNAFVQKYTPIGVFTASAAQGQAAPVQYIGNATLATAFQQPYAINAQGNSPPGQKMNIVGNSAILYGIQAPSAQTQIN